MPAASTALATTATTIMASPRARYRRTAVRKRAWVSASR